MGSVKKNLPNFFCFHKFPKKLINKDFNEEHKIIIVIYFIFKFIMKNIIIYISVIHMCSQVVY